MTDGSFSPFYVNRREFLAASGAALTLVALPQSAMAVPAGAHGSPADLPPPDWIRGVTRMAFAVRDDFERAAKAGAQVIHTNLVWPYYPLRRDGGGLSEPDDRALRELVDQCHRLGMRLSLGLPPFPSVALVKEHPDWRVHPDATGGVLQVEPREDNLGTRVGCNLGPWGDYLIEVCAELTAQYGIDGFSFDGNYHAALCFCPACQEAHRADVGRELPAAANLDDVAYREYLVWRGARLIDHYRRLRRRLREENSEAALMSWSVNAGRYGHFLYSPRAMPTELNRVFDLPMQEWWLDETNLGASVCPAFGAAYVRAASRPNPAASEAYLMSRGNPYGTDSFPAHERLARTLLAVTNGCVSAESFGWPGHAESTVTVMNAVAERAPWMINTRPLPWAGLLVSEQTRQFYAYRDIAERFLPHVFGAFRMAAEEHLPVTLLNDWDLLDAPLSDHAVLILPNAAALSDAQANAVRDYVRSGGGLVATGETSLCDELGRPRRDFALADLFGVAYAGRPRAPLVRPELDVNFSVTVDEKYWAERVGVARLSWGEHVLFEDEKLKQLVPQRSVTFRGPQVAVTVPALVDEVAARMLPEGSTTMLPAIVARPFGQGRVVYLAAAVDAALWSYAYPYQRRLLANALRWAARESPPVSVTAPMCVQAASYLQPCEAGERLLVHLFNGLNTTANHGQPAADVPLREETVPIHGIVVSLHGQDQTTFHLEPGHTPLTFRRREGFTDIDIPPLDVQAILVAEK